MHQTNGPGTPRTHNADHVTAATQTTLPAAPEMGSDGQRPDNRPTASGALDLVSNPSGTMWAPQDFLAHWHQANTGLPVS